MKFKLTCGNCGNEIEMYNLSDSFCTGPGEIYRYATDDTYTDIKLVCSCGNQITMYAARGRE